MSAGVAHETSYECGSDAIPLVYLTIGEALEQSAGQWPDREALVFVSEGARWTYAELNERIKRIAAGLIALGLQPQDRLAVWAPNSVDWVLTHFAAAKAGLILVSINPAYRSRELHYALAKAQCKALMCSRTFRSRDNLPILREIFPELGGPTSQEFEASRLTHLKHLIQFGAPSEPGFRPFAELATLASSEALKELDQLQSSLQPDDPITIQYTSGTTGAPKGATLSHFSLLNNARFVGHRIELTEADRACICLPLYHCSGIMQNLFCIAYGCTMVYPAEWFDATAVLQAIQQERCTVLGGVPTMFSAELEEYRRHRYDLSSLRAGYIGGAPPPQELLRRIVNELGIHRITVVYGMTETSPISFQTTADTPLETLVRVVGRVHPHVEAKIIDRNGHIAHRGESGEILVRGYSVMVGYWDDEKHTKEAIDAAGWMHSGDLGAFDQEGYLRIIGRLKDMIIRGGENIYPAEIENFLHSHPAIDDVYVFGVPDEHYGEQVCAWIKVRTGHQLGAAEVISHCRGRIASFKIPSYIRFVSEFPMTPTGKAQKFVMQKAMTAELQGGLMKRAGDPNSSATANQQAKRP